MGFSLLAIVGPTASGKSSLAISVARALQEQGIASEIINADSMQLYRGLDIGTAKLTHSEMQGVTHHLLDVIEPSQEMTAVEYSKLAQQKISDLTASGVMPILVGGSMFYVAAALDRLDFAPTDPSIRAELEARALEIGKISLHAELAALDPVSAKNIHSQNSRKVIRALEVIALTGQPFSSSFPEPEYLVPTLTLGIDVDREALKTRIAKRVSGMWEGGILDEAERLATSHSELSKTAKAAIGYNQAFRQLAGDCEASEAIAETIQLTNRYARRQMSWFRRDKRTVWLQDDDNLLDAALQRIRLEQ